MIDNSRESQNKSKYEEFLIAEYNNVAQAHFNTVTSISEFFKHYMIIISLPIPVAVIFLNTKEFNSSLFSYLIEHPIILLFTLTLITLLGLCVLGYIINLRFDALLYARTVNGIRKYFYKLSGFEIEEEIRIRVLPKSIYFPLYFELRYFLFVVLAFAFVGTFYFLVGLYVYWNANPFHTGYFLALGIVCFVIHIILYKYLGNYREDGEYIKSHIVGIDIDGVLNEHRTHFAKILEEQVQKIIDPEKITTLPVHEMPNSNVSEDDEHAVFNCPRYWNDMPSTEKAEQVMKKLKNQLGYSIWIFTHRGWPGNPPINNGI